MAQHVAVSVAAAVSRPASLQGLTRSETRQRIAEDEALIADFEADDRVFLERRFVSFCVVLVVIVAVFSSLIFVMTYVVKPIESDKPEIHQCLENASLALLRACNFVYNVTCKNSALVIDVGG